MTAHSWSHMLMPVPAAKPPPGALSKSVASILREHIGPTGTVRDELASTIGVSRRQLDRFLTGERILDIEQFAAICAAIGMDPSHVLARAAGK